MSKVIARLIVDATIVAVILFASAGTLAWWRGWALVVALLTTRTIGAVIGYRVNPVLLRERAGMPLHADQSWPDRLLVVGVLVTGHLGLLAIAALDRFHWHLLPRPIPSLTAAGLGLFVIGWAIKGAALRANAFATVAVRSQGGHAVATAGPYRVVRHPFYAADPLIFLGLSLWLESYTAAVASLVPIGLLVVRLLLEERFLRETLPGYHEYAKQVRYRLVPRLW